MMTSASMGRVSAVGMVDTVDTAWLISRVGIPTAHQEAGRVELGEHAVDRVVAG